MIERIDTRKYIYVYFRKPLYFCVSALFILLLLLCTEMKEAEEVTPSSSRVTRDLPGLLHRTWLVKVRQNTAWRNPAFFISKQCYCLCWLRLSRGWHRLLSLKQPVKEMKSPTQVWFLETIFFFFFNGTLRAVSRAIVCMLPQIPTDFVQESWPCLWSTHHFLALPITTESTQWKPHSLKSEIISFLVWQPALLPYFPWVNCHFQHMQQLIVVTSSTGFHLDKNQDFSFTKTFIFFQRRNAIYCYTNSKQNPGESTEIIFP